MLLAGETPNLAQKNGAIKEIRARPKNEGFYLKVEKAGLMAQAEGQHIKKVFELGGIEDRRAPLVLLVELAKELGTTPVAPF